MLEDSTLVVSHILLQDKTFTAHRRRKMKRCFDWQTEIIHSLETVLTVFFSHEVPSEMSSVNWCLFSRKVCLCCDVTGFRRSLRTWGDTRRSRRFRASAPMPPWWRTRGRSGGFETEICKQNNVSHIEKGVLNGKPIQIVQLDKVKSILHSGKIHILD